MNRNTQLAFLALVVIQTLHSIEEYTTALYERLAPATFVSGLFSDNLAQGFAIFNTGLVAFGYWCYFVPVRSGSNVGRRLAWGWAWVELSNGVGHTAFAISVGGYFSGALTAPLLVATAAILMKFLRRDQADTA